MLSLLLLAAVTPLSWAEAAPSDMGTGEDAGRSPPFLGPPFELAGVRANGCSTCPDVCSLRHPICVHGTGETTASAALGTLDAAERAWDALTGALGVPAPDGGLDGIWRVDLVDDRVDGDGQALLSARDPRAHLDRGASRAIVDRATPSGCQLDLALARAVARGSLWREAPAADEGSARAEVEALARLVTPCASGADDLRAFQAKPQRAIVSPASSAFGRGASLFFNWLDAAFGTQPAKLILGLWALSPTRTPPGASRWASEPTAFDVLRISLANALWQGSTIDDIFAKFAVERASADPPAHPAWHVPWPVEGRRLLAPEPVEPTGASYVLIDCAGAPAGARLRLEAEWEDYGRMRWFAMKLDAAGRTKGELPIRSNDRAKRASMTIDALEGVAQVLAVGVNVGSTEHPFDPDQGEWEPHGWLLTVEGE